MTQQSSQAVNQSTHKSAARPTQHTYAKAAASCAILAIVSLQAYTAFLRRPCDSVRIPVYCDLPAEPGLYPFLDYPMYSRIMEEGTQVNRDVLIATFADGSEQPLTAADFNTSLYWFKNGLIDALRTENYAQIRAYVESYESIGNPAIETLRLESKPLQIMREGIIDQPSELVIEVPKDLLRQDAKEAAGGRDEN